MDRLHPSIICTEFLFEINAIYLSLMEAKLVPLIG